MPLTRQDQDNVKRFIEQDEPEMLVKTAQDVGKALAEQDRLKTNQIRNIFGEARKIQARWRSTSESSQRTALILLKPKLEYQAARHKEVGRLRDWLVASIDAVTINPNRDKEYDRFKRFMQFFEAILAYHKASGGID